MTASHAGGRQARVQRFFQHAHRWLGLLLGVQILLWMMSGVVMSWFSIELVRGQTTSVVDFPQELDARNYAAPGGVIAQIDGARDVRLKTWLGRPVYIVEGSAQTAMFSALSGKRLSPISEANARTVARRDFAGEGEIATVQLTKNPPPEYRGATPVWRVNFDDWMQSRLYISPYTGEVVSRRNRVWRLYDFFWMLHIMDYEDRTDFNNPLLKAASATGLLFALTGLFMVIVRLKNGRYRVRRARAQQSEQIADDIEGGPKLTAE